MTTLDLTVRIGTLADVEREKLLWYEHAQAVHGNGHCAAPKLPVFRALEAEGRLVVAVVEGGGQVVGYAIAGLIADLHRDQTRAWCSSLFVSPGYRRGGTALRLMHALEHECMARGASQMMWPAPADSTLDKMMRRMRGRYRTHEIVYTRSMVDG